jgi:protein-S-isoprenylcysteine O-methyltransferase Ste14
MTEQTTKSTRWKLTPNDIIIMSIEGIGFAVQIGLCAFFYNTLGLRWLLYLGWAIFAVAMVLGWRARADLQTKGGSREGESWLATRTIVTTGVYGLVRHPMYLSFQLISLSLVFLSQHWLSAVMGAIIISLIYIDMGREERNNLKKLGNGYKRYMERVPRMNVVAGTVRLLQSRHSRREA